MPNQIVPGATTVAVTSGKGGVGKSTTGVALAAALTARGHDVVVDADIEGPNVHLLADVTDPALPVALVR
jgi:MinD-like ATPase involved in chromosome partitioning or flagellar assembly